MSLVRAGVLILRTMLAMPLRMLAWGGIGLGAIGNGWARVFLFLADTVEGV